MPSSLAELETQGYLKSFDEVHQEVAEWHDLRHPDRVIDLSQLIVTEKLNIRVPGLGILEMTRWAKTQIGNTLGIKWDKWFATKTRAIPPREIQEELARRFNRLPGMRRMIRSRKHEVTTARSDGVLEAFLSPTYEKIDDIRIFDRLRDRFADRMSEMRLLRHPSRTFTGDWSWGWGGDRTSHYVFLTGEEHDLGGGGVPDNHLPGFLLKNSEVGSASLSMDDFWLRVVCMSGLLAMTDNRRLLYRQHRRIEDEDLEALMGGALDRLEVRHSEFLDKLVESRGLRVEDPPEVLESFLSKCKESTNKFVEQAQEAWEEDRHFTRFAVALAITRAAQRTRDLDRRTDFEHLAGRFLLID